MNGLSCGEESMTMFSRFDTIPACDGRTDGRPAYSYNDWLLKMIDLKVFKLIPMTHAPENLYRFPAGVLCKSVSMFPVPKSGTEYNSVLLGAGNRDQNDE